MTIRSATPANINTVWAAMVAGDTMELASGNYGTWSPALKGFASDTFVQPAAGASPVFTQINIPANESHVVFQKNGAAFIEVDDAGNQNFGFVHIAHPCSFLTFDGMKAGSYAAGQSKGYFDYTMSGYCFYIVEGPGGTFHSNITIKNCEIYGYGLGIVMFDTTDFVIQDNTMYGTSNDHVRLDGAAGSSGASMGVISGNKTFGFFLDQRVGSDPHADHYQVSDSLGHQANDNVHFVNNIMGQVSRSRILPLGSPGNGEEAQGLFIGLASATVPANNWLIEQNYYRGCLGNGFLLYNLTNGTVRFNDCGWYADPEQKQLPAIELRAGTGADLQSANTVSNNVAFAFTTDNPTANTFFGNVTLQYEFPGADNYASNHYVDFNRNRDLRTVTETALDPTLFTTDGLARIPASSGVGGLLNGVGCTTNEANIVPILYVLPGYQRMTADSLTCNMEIRNFSTDDQTGLGASDFNWDFGDGTTLSGVGPSQSHTYANMHNGPYTVTVHRISTATDYVTHADVQSPYVLDLNFNADDFTNQAEGFVTPLRSGETVTGAWGSAGTFGAGADGDGIVLASGNYATVDGATTGFEQMLYNSKQHTITFDMKTTAGMFASSKDVVGVLSSYYNVRFNGSASVQWIIFLASGAFFVNITLPAAVDDGAFHHFIFSYDGNLASPSHPVKVWMDGVAVAPASITGAPTAVDRFTNDQAQRAFNIGVSGGTLAATLDNVIPFGGLLTPSDETSRLTALRAGMSAGGGGGGGANDNEAFLVGVGDMAIG